MSFRNDMKIHEIFKKVKDDMSQYVEKSTINNIYDLKLAEQNFLINEIAKLKLEIEELKEKNFK